MTITTISPAELAERLRTGLAIEIIDVRTPMEFQEFHVVGARNVPLDVLEPAKLMEGRTGSAAGPIYVICRSGSRGKQACEKFLAAGYTNIINVEGGSLACIECGMPVLRGKKVISLDRQVRIAAGSLVVLGAALGWLVHPIFIGLAAFVGAGLVCAGVTDKCGMGMMLAKMPWNRVPEEPTKACCNH